MAKTAKQSKARPLLSAKATAELWGFTPHRLRQLEREGWFSKKGRNRYDPIEVGQGYVKFLQDDARRSSKTKEASALHAARTREIDLRIAREEGLLVEADDVQALVTEIVAGFVAELHGVPAGSTRDLEVRTAIEEVLNGAIDRCRTRFEKLSADLENGRGIVLEVEEATA